MQSRQYEATYKYILATQANILNRYYLERKILQTDYIQRIVQTLQTYAEDKFKKYFAKPPSISLKLFH